MLASLAAALAAMVVAQLITVAMLVGFAALIAGFVVRDQLRFRGLAASRRGESICTFARSFDLRMVDTRIIRATHEELQPYYHGICPIRAADRLAAGMFIDDDELDEVASEIARRSGRSMDRPEGNPYFGRVVTVGDLVHFVAHQSSA